MQRGYVACEECNGTGAEVPDCTLCRGMRTIHANRAYAAGYKRDDLEDYDQWDRFCLCPRCDGDVCGQCQGDGSIERIVAKQEFDRLLIFAKTQRLPPLLRKKRRGRMYIEYSALLSRSAAVRAREKHLIHWFCSVFGDEISLTPKGKIEAERAVARQCKRAISYGVVFAKAGDE